MVDRIVFICTICGQHPGPKREKLWDSSLVTPPIEDVQLTERQHWILWYTYAILTWSIVVLRVTHYQQRPHEILS
jgi:hypothetical protein